MYGLRHIPRSKLPDTMYVRLPDGQGGYQEGFHVINVRFDRTQEASPDEHRSADAGRGEVYVDGMFSEPHVAVPVGSRVQIGGHSYLVTRCHEYRDWGGRPHHWKLTVR